MGSTKEEVLASLEHQRGTAVSGQRLSDELGISRAAIWKAVKDLQQEGHAIDASPRVGYRMQQGNTMLSVAGIAACLPPATSGRVDLHVFDELVSTNSEAKRMAMQEASHGTVVVADHQTGGRGRMGRQFFSPTGSGVYLSIIIRPEIDATKALLSTTAAALGVCRAIEELGGPRASIKWVNDIYCRDRKVCGILTEGTAGFENGRIESVIIGIGLNYNTPESSFPVEIRQTAASLFPAEIPFGASRNRLAALVIHHVMELVDNLSDPQIINEYRTRSMVLGKQVRVLSGNTTYEALATSISDTGALVVSLGDGSTKILNTGEISLRPVAGSTWGG